jgi:3-dehydroquinate dehydratase-2
MPVKANQATNYLQMAHDVIEAVGGSDNVVASDVCMSRLRLSLEDASRVNLDHLNTVRSVLGVTRRSENGYDVIFGPSVIDGVYRDFVELSGVEGVPQDLDVRQSEPTVAKRRREPAMSVTITTPHERGSEEGIEPLLDRMGATEASPASESEGEAMGRVLVINGPNINMLGTREPDIYGTETYQDLVDLCRKAAIEAGFTSCRCFQSNHEGDIVDEIQAAYGAFDGIVLNPAAYTHTSVAILDALKAVSIPCVEVHISKVEEREGFRQVSYVREACFETITGLGLDGYRKAIFDLADHLRASPVG